MCVVRQGTPECRAGTVLVIMRFALLAGGSGIRGGVLRDHEDNGPPDIVAGTMAIDPAELLLPVQARRLDRSQQAPHRGGRSLGRCRRSGRGPGPVRIGDRHGYR